VKIAAKSTYDLLIKSQTDRTLKAALLSLPECQGIGNTETEAIEALDQIFQVRLGNARIMTL
jgi:predicted RNase H-like HicB family nuclease